MLLLAWISLIVGFWIGVIVEDSPNGVEFGGAALIITAVTILILAGAGIVKLVWG